VAVQIVWDVPSTGGGARVLRGIGVALGAILVFAALIVAAVPLLVVLVTVDDLRNGRRPAVFDAQGLLGLAGFAAGSIVGLWLGLRLIRGRRRLGL
jgi:hypothetical protein